MNTRIPHSILQSEITLIDGEKAKFFKEEKDGKQIFEHYTVRMALRKAISSTFPDEQNMDADKKIERYMLASKIWNAQEMLELSPSEATEVKKCSSKIYGIEIIGFINEILIPEKSSSN